ncbi:F-box/kelch-repeat protein At3g13680-like [Brassica rapa]|uniref:F-box/kelch-repeat protein At3g13680-like n=1 Tax=Brassica campestris TaxID=3711 RepID=UPI00142E0C2C|nr:F-box/kelch-repeat protein At3g13680-like [Brassica rapa]
MKTIFDCWFKKTKKKKKKKTILDLPEDLVEDEIISRLPISSLRSVRSTCKKWNTLCKNRILFGKAAKKQFLMMDSRRICLMNFDLSKDNGDPSIKQVSVLDQKFQIPMVFQSDGLLLCVLKDYSRLVVWNPYLGQMRWIEPRHSFHSSDRFALGHDSNFNYKILRISSEIHPVTERKVLGFELYDFTSSSWKVLDDVTPKRQIRSCQQCESLKGNAYFLTSVRGSFRCFDFTTERFGPPLPLPPFHSYDGFHCTSFSCVREEQQLAVLYQRWEWESSDTIEISVTDKIGPDDVSWTKFLKVNTGYWVYPTARSFLVDEEKKLAVVFVLDKLSSGCLYQTAHVFGQDGYFKYVRIGEAPYLRNMVCSSYLPSLLQLNQPG